MKLPIIAAALGVVLAAAAPVAAQHTVVTERTVVRHGDHRGDHGRWHTRRVCQTQWRHHHRVRVCRTVRGR